MNSNKWGALSMRDRAFLIREAVRNGITDINSIRDTWEHRFDDTEFYRSVEDKADSLQWKKEYREKYGHQFSGEGEPQRSAPSWWERFKTMTALQGGDPDTPIFIDYRDIQKADNQEAAKLFEEQNKAASELDIKKGKATVNALAFIGGLKNPFGLLGDLGITTASTLANTAIEGNTDNFIQDLGVNAIFDILGHGAGKVSNFIKSGVKNTKYNISLEDALKSGKVPDDKKSFFEIMLKRRPEIAEKLWSRELRRSQGPLIDRSKLYYNKDWYKSRLKNKGYSEDEIEKILQHYNTQLDLVDGVSFVNLPEEMLGRTHSFTLGDKKVQHIELSNLLKEEPTISKAMDDVLTHEVGHATSFTGDNLPVGVDNSSIVLTPDFKRDINPELFDYYSNPDEQRVRLLSFADFAETKFGGDYEKAYQFISDTQKSNWLSKDKTYINGDLTDLVRTFKKEDVIKGAKNVLSISPIIGVSPFILQNQSTNKENSSHTFSGEENTKVNWKSVGSTLYDIGEIVDPTGISSWATPEGDLYQAIKGYKEGTVGGGEVALNVLGAIPILGPIGKAIKIGKGGARVAKTISKAAKNAKVVDDILELIPGVRKATSATQAVTGAATQALGDVLNLSNNARFWSNKGIQVLNTANTMSDVVGAIGNTIDRDYTQDSPSVVQEDPNTGINKALLDASRRLEEEENSKNNRKGGWDEKNKRWYPHPSPEGGAHTIGYGIKLNPNTKWAKVVEEQGYLSEDQEKQARLEMLEDSERVARTSYDNRFGKGEWDKLDFKPQSLLIDRTYNAGSISKFPNFVKAIHDGDLEGMRDQYKVYMTKGKGKRKKKVELGRNKTISREIDSLEQGFYPIFKEN